MSRHAALHRFSRSVRLFNPFPFIHFLTPARCRNALNSFIFIHLHALFITTEGWVAGLKPSLYKPGSLHSKSRTCGAPKAAALHLNLGVGTIVAKGAAVLRLRP